MATSNSITREYMLKQQSIALGKLELLRDQLSAAIRQDAPQREIDGIMVQMETALNACWDAGCATDIVVRTYTSKEQGS